MTGEDGRVGRMGRTGKTGKTERTGRTGRDNNVEKRYRTVGTYTYDLEGTM